MLKMMGDGRQPIPTRQKMSMETGLYAYPSIVMVKLINVREKSYIITDYGLYGQA